MTRLSTMTGIALVTALTAAPAAAQSQNQQQMQNQQNQRLGQQQLSQEGQACVDELQAVDRDLSELGYGSAGPGGYGIYGAPYAVNTNDPGTTGAGSDVTQRPLAASPRADMYALMRAGYVMARTGHDEGCRQVVAVVEDIGDRYREAIEDADYRAGLTDWRRSYLANTTSVTEVEQPIRAEQIIGADLRNPQDEDLGDIEDVVVGPNGEIRYVIASAGGFLGLGEDEVPVPWQDLEVTAAPYNDTFVLDVSEQAFEDAPRLEGDRRQLATGERSQRIDRYWQQQADTGRQQNQ